MATSKQSVKSKTETSITMNWSSDSVVDYLWYSTDNGKSWVGINVTDSKGSTYTINKLSANTTYKIKTRIRSKDSQKTTDSSTISVTTYNYPYCTSAPSFTLGATVELRFYNPLKRSFKFYIIGNGTQIDVEYQCSGTSYFGLSSTTTSVPYLYKTIPNSFYGKYKVKVVYGTSTKTFDDESFYYINESECYPTFTSFNFKDTTTANITNSAFLIKGLSKLGVEIPTANKMVVKNGANPKNYTVSLGTTSKTISYSDSKAVSTDFGVVTTTGKKSISVRAYDSRKLSTLVTKSITVYDYNEPIIFVDVKRTNNYGKNATLKVNGRYSPLTVNKVNKNKIKSCVYRYRETGGTWSDWITLTTTVSSGKFTCNTVTFDNLENDKSFEFEVKVTDNLDKVGTDTATLSEGQGIFFISSNKKTCYVNGEEVATKTDTRQTKYYTKLETGTDLDTINEIGTYRSENKENSATMYNLPSGIAGGFVLYVVTWTATPINQEYRRQELIYSRMSYVRYSTNGGQSWSAWSTTAYLEDIYPVGAVYINSSNTNPASKIGGTWELIDKGFKTASVSDSTAFNPSTNVVVDSCHISRNAASIRLRVCLEINTTITDTGLLLGNFDFAKIGIESMPMGYYGLLGYSDKANGGIACELIWDSGNLYILDVFNVTSVASGNKFYLDFTFNLQISKMINSFCDKFYWQRTG